MILSSFRNFIARSHFYPLFASGFVLYFFFTRVSYFLYYHELPGFGMDSTGDYRELIRFLSGVLPVFNERQPGYTVFLYMCELPGLSTKGILAVQSITSLLMMCLAQMVVNRNIPQYRYAFFIPLLLFYSSSQFLNYDTFIGPTFLFADFILLAAVFMIAALFSNKKSLYLFASFFILGVILIRQQGLFLVPVWLVITFYLVLNRQFTNSLLFSAPLILGILLFFSYNKHVYNYFGFSKVMTKLGISVFYLDTLDTYSEGTSKIIAEINSHFSAEDRNILNESWSYPKLKKIITMENYDRVWAFYKVFYQNPGEFNRLAKNSFSLKGYLKFVYSNFIAFFDLTTQKFPFYYQNLFDRQFTLTNLFDSTNTDKSYRIIFKEFYPYVHHEKKLSAGIIDGNKPSYASRMHEEVPFIKVVYHYHRMYNTLFKNLSWIILYFLSFIFSIVLFLSAREIRRDVLIMAVLFAMPLLNNFVVTLSIPPVERYVFPTEVFYYLYLSCILTITIKIGHRYFRTQHRNALS